MIREQLKELTAREKITHQKRLNAARVAAYREANKEKAAKYNRSCTKEQLGLTAREKINHQESKCSESCST